MSSITFDILSFVKYRKELYFNKHKITELEECNF
jgi:hypothetical protein